MPGGKGPNIRPKTIPAGPPAHNGSSAGRNSSSVSVSGGDAAGGGGDAAAIAAINSTVLRFLLVYHTRPLRDVVPGPA